jgi:nifR3 family TIM-barrel protein
VTDFWKKLNKPITILAPMDDVTDVVFREIITHTSRPDVFFTEFTSADAICSKGREIVARKLAYTQNQRPIVAQIWGSIPEAFDEAAKFIKELGFDGIDVNMGCPDKGVQKKGGGAALINNYELVEKLINAIKSGAPDLPISIKTRLASNKSSTEQWISFLLSQNINALTLHARTAEELSKVPANWDEIGKAVQLKNKINPQVTIIGNGDIKSYKDVIAKHIKYGIDGVMIGRGIFHDPWLFDKNEKPKLHTTAEHFHLMVNHAKLFNETWGKTKNYEVMKKFFKVYVKDFKGANEFRQQLMDTKSYEDFLKVISNFDQSSIFPNL